jgi:hypothetical protein
VLDSDYKMVLWQQFGASIDMLENAINACPEKVWGNKFEFSEFWYISYHTLFWLDYYLSDDPENFLPPEPFTLGEFDPSGLFPERVYAKDELLKYLEYGRQKCRTRIQLLSDENLQQQLEFGSMKANALEILLYNMRHVQHHSGQLNLVLRQSINDAPKYVGRTKKKLEV